MLKTSQMFYYSVCVISALFHEEKKKETIGEKNWKEGREPPVRFSFCWKVHLSGPYKKQQTQPLSLPVSLTLSQPKTGVFLWALLNYCDFTGS